jgi:nucleoside-diphosphate-sugar epimerase
VLQEVLDEPLSVVDGGQRAGDPMRLVADISRIRREVGWEPQTGLRDGLVRTLSFYSSHRDLWDDSGRSERRAAA